MSPTVPAIPTANLEMSSQILLDEDAKSNDKVLDKYASNQTWSKKSPAID
jgi:hypothetical protein